MPTRSCTGRCGEAAVYSVVVIGTSWGGLQALSVLVERLHPDVRVPIAIAQHRHADSDRGLFERLLGGHAHRPVVEADDKMKLEPNTIYTAPPDYHLLVEDGYFALSVDERVQFSRPSIDVLFTSAADTYGPGTIGVVLTGANEDGAEGLAYIKARGGVAVVQDPRTAERHEMPDAAIAAAHADAILPLEDIPPFLYGLVCAEDGR